MSSNYKQDESQLKTIIQKHAQPVSNSHELKLIIYYKSRKIKNIFIKNNVHHTNDIAEKYNVVYQWTCDRDGCNSTNQEYIGYTTCTIKERFRTHTQNSSSIKKHLRDQHQIQKITTAQLIPSIKILYTSSDKRDLIFTEALLIKSQCPTLHSQPKVATRSSKFSNTNRRPKKMFTHNLLCFILF